MPRKDGTYLKRQGIMLCYPYSTKRLQAWRSPALVQPKLDGERCRAEWHPIYELYILYSSTGAIISLPHINLSLKEQLANTVANTVANTLDGELYIHGTPRNEIRSLISKQSSKVEYHVFDIINSAPQRERQELLTGLDLQEPIHIVPGTFIPDPTEDLIMEYLDQYVAQGYEGLIVRHAEALYETKRSTNIMKFKPHQQDVYKIVGYQEEKDNEGHLKGALGALYCISPAKASADLKDIFSVGSGFTQEQRHTLWPIRNTLINKYVRIKYQTLSKNGLPMHSVILDILENNDDSSTS